MKLIVGMAAFLMATVAWAQVAEPVPVPIPGFEWIAMVIAFIQNIPGVGPVLAVAFEIVAMIAAVATALVVFVQTILHVPYIVAKWAGASVLAEQIKAVSDKVLPWLKYLSMFNVQKK